MDYQVAENLQALVYSYTPAEIEDVLFNAFEAAHLAYPDERTEYTETRIHIHALLRGVLRNLTPELTQEIHQWTTKKLKVREQLKQLSDSFETQ